VLLEYRRWEQERKVRRDFMIASSFHTSYNIGNGSKPPGGGTLCGKSALPHGHRIRSRPILERLFLLFVMSDDPTSHIQKHNVNPRAPALG
jgi:hypothetical protein